MHYYNNNIQSSFSKRPSIPVDLFQTGTSTLKSRSRRRTSPARSWLRHIKNSRTLKSDYL